jgi:hypothetical protein
LKKKTKETIFIGIGLISLSLILHYIHYFIFKDAHHTLLFLVGDIAFIPMDVFFTTLVLDRLLEIREKQNLFQKLNMIVGIFYTELGTKLLTHITVGDNDISDLIQDSCIKKSLEALPFEKLNKDILNHNYNLDISKLDLNFLQSLLDENRDLLITLITNESLLDHETFTEMIMSLMHLKEELNSRYSDDIEEYEVEHIQKDIEIAYKYLTIEWFEYMKYVSNNYPTLFLKALINNPFDRRSKKEKDSIYLNNGIIY